MEKVSKCGTIIKYSKGTTPTWELPEHIYYARHPKHVKIVGFLARKHGSNALKRFSINKYGLEIAYYRAIKCSYPNTYKKILGQYPTPTIADKDLYVIKRLNNTGVYGVILSFNHPDIPEHNSYLTSFITYDPISKKSFNISIRKYGLEEAWLKAVTFRYTHYDPLPNDDASFKPEWWDMINPKYKTKTR